MDGSTSRLSDLLDLAPFFPDDGPALGGGHQEVEGEGVTVLPAVAGPVSALPLLSPLQGLADESVCLAMTTSNN